MLCEEIQSHAQIQALQALCNEQGRSNEIMLVNLVFLESVRIARESYAILCQLMMESKFWECSEMDLLSVVAGLSLEVQKLEHDLLPKLMEAKLVEAKLERDALEALILMKNSAITLIQLGKCFKEALEVEALGVLLKGKDQISARVENLSMVLKDTAVRVLKGNCNIVWLQTTRVPWLVQLVTEVLETPVCFSDSDE